MRRQHLSWVTLLGVAWLPGLCSCGPTPENPRGSCPPGVQLHVTPARWVGEGARVAKLGEQDSVELLRPPQGGHVLLVAGEVTGMRGNSALMRARLVDPGTGNIYAQEERTLTLVPVPGEPGVLTPNTASRSQVNHLPVCPDYLGRDVEGQPWLLELNFQGLLEDGTVCGEATRAVTIIPICPLAPVEAQQACQCECRAGYVLGSCAP